MKFSDGGWLFREGFDVKFAVHVYDARKEETNWFYICLIAMSDIKGQRWMADC